MIKSPTSKYDLLRKYTTSSSIMDELCAYTENKFVNTEMFSNDLLVDTTDDAFLPAWEDYLRQSKKIGVFQALQQNLVQLQFPIRKNISQSIEYRAAMLKGSAPDKKTAVNGLRLNEADALDFFIYESFAGKIPVIVASSNEDFVSLIRALTYRNEPIQLPKSMGAAMIKGLNNWDRIHRLKAEWLKKNPLGNWNKEFQRNVLPHKNLYQDKLIVLSRKPYSGVQAKHIGATEDKWLDYSLKIRLEHECAHLYTLKTFGSMANNMHDELIADYMGITKVLGKFKSDWFLRFIGLENYPEYREGGRLQNYLNEPKLSIGATKILRSILRKAAINLEAFDDALGLPSDQEDRINRLNAICSIDLIRLSSEFGENQLLKQYNRLLQTV